MNLWPFAPIVVMPTILVLLMYKNELQRWRRDKQTDKNWRQWNDDRR